MVYYSFSLLDILPYYVVVVLLYYYINKKTTSQKRAFYCFCILFIFSAIRYGIGYDYYVYRALATHKLMSDRIELFSKYLLDLAYNSHYQVFFVLSAFLTLYPLYRAFIKQSVNPSLSLLIYYLFPLFFLGIQSAVRNGIAFSLVFYAFTLLFDGGYKKKGLSIVFLVCACFFHKSAVIGVLIYPIFFLKHYLPLHLVFYILSFGASYIVTNTIGAYYSQSELLDTAQHYIIDKASEGGGTMTLIVNGLGIFNLLLWHHFSTIDRKITILMGMFNIGVCIWNVFQGVDITLATRLSIFFMLALTLLVPYYEKNLKNLARVNIKKLIHVFFLILFSSSFVINVNSFIQHGGRMSNVPYQTIFYHKDYYNLQ